MIKYNHHNQDKINYVADCIQETERLLRRLKDYKNELVKEDKHHLYQSYNRSAVKRARIDLARLLVKGF